MNTPMNPSPPPPPPPRDNAARLEEIFDAALSRPPAEREAYLGDACACDDTLRAEVRALLAANDAAGDFMKATAPLPPEVEAELARLKPEEASDRIGPYKLLQQIGEGGFGVVWMAEQEQPVRRRVALKIIKLGMDTKEVVARFGQERQALAMMDHPNIAKVFDAGATPTGRPFFVMELVRGIRITDYCDQANLPTANRLQLFIAVCHAVQHAHQKGIIHRDLKPSNILVTLQDGVPVPKVIDFGVAKATQQRLTDLTLFTQFEQMIGTPLYMSPEQAEGSLDVDTRADIYALGVLLYELLTGRTPFDPAELMRKGLDEIRRVIREQEPPRPSTALSTMTADAMTAIAQHRHSDSAKLIGLLRGDLDWIVMKAIEKDRTRRYDTANAFAEDIQRHLASEPVIASPPSRAYRLQKLVRRHRFAVAAGTAVAVALILGIAGSAWQAVRATKAEKLAEGRRMQAEAAANQARESLSQSDFLQALRSIEENRNHDALAQLARSLSVNPRNDAALCRLTTFLIYHGFALPISRMNMDNVFETNSAQLSPDGKRIVITSGDTARVCDAQSGHPLTKPMQHDGMVQSAQFSPDGKRIVTSSRDERGGKARVWDAQNGQPLIEPVKHRAKFYPAQFSPDGKRIITMWDYGPQVWDVQSGEALSEPLKHSGRIDSAQFSPDGTRVVTASWDKTARVWDAHSGQPLTGPLQHDGKVHSAQFNPAGNRILTASEDKTARVWDAQSGSLLAGPLQHGAAVNSAEFSLNGGRILTVSEDKTARVWDAQDGQPQTGPLAHDDAVNSAHFSPDGNFIVTASGNAAQIWSAQSGKPLTEPMKHDAWVSSVQFSPDGKRIVTGSGQGQFGVARVYDAQGGKQLAGMLFEYEGKVTSAQFSPDGLRIVTASEDGTARVWDAQSGQPLTEPMKHAESVDLAQFSPAGRRIVTASGDNTTRVWDAQNGRSLTEPLKHGGGVDSAEVSQGGKRSAQFSPDGKRIVTASGDNTARVWDISARGQASAWLPRLAEAVAGQHLNDRGVFEQLNEDQGRVLEEIRAQLSSAPSDDDWTILGRWFLADRSTRTISPFSKITVPEYIENRIKENTPASLDEAERLALGNAELLQRTAQAKALLKSDAEAVPANP